MATGRLFWSDFEEAITFTRTYPGTTQAQDRMTSPVNSKGYSWPPANFAVDTYLQYLSNFIPMSDVNFSDYFLREIVLSGDAGMPATGHNGTVGKKLFRQRLSRPLAIKRLLENGVDFRLREDGGYRLLERANEPQYYDGPAGDQLQNPIIMVPRWQYRKDRPIYQRMWIFVPSDLFTYNIPNTESPPASGWFANWRNMWAYKTGSVTVSALGDRRGFVRIGNTAANGHHWELALDQNANGGLPDVTLFSYKASGAAPIPGDWFKMETLLKHSQYGFFKAAINDKVVGSFIGNTLGIRRKGIDRYFAWSLYHGGFYPSSQWIDEFEIWVDTVPTDSVFTAEVTPGAPIEAAAPAASILAMTPATAILVSATLGLIGDELAMYGMSYPDERVATVTDYGDISANLEGLAAETPWAIIGTVPKAWLDDMTNRFGARKTVAQAINLVNTGYAINPKKPRHTR